MCDSQELVPITKHFLARIVTFGLSKPLVADSLELIQGSLKEACSISRMKSILNKSTGQVLKKNPRMLSSNQTAIVEIRVKHRAICVETFKQSRELGRFMLRLNGETVAAGIIQEILGYEQGVEAS